MPSDVEARVARLEAAADIRALKMRYARLCDAQYPPDELGKLFTEDAVWDGGDKLGYHTGNQAIREFFAGSSKRVAWAMHYTVAGDIHVAEDAQTATGSWYLWQPMTRHRRAVWLMATYEDEYVRLDDGWLFSHVKVTAQALTPIEEGWEKERFA